MTYDIVLIHPPSLLDFRMHPSYGGPISEVVPSLYVFDMYPFGFLTLASYLESKGFKVGIFNIASKMLSSGRFDPVRFLEKLDAKVYGIDLHWLVHAQGALKVASIVKRKHPNSIVMLGGLTASYYWREILENYSYVDVVMLGDTTEAPVEKLIENIGDESSFREIPNLAWRNDGRILFNGFAYVPEEFSHLINPRILVSNAIKTRDIFMTVPYYGFVKKPIVAILTVKGCLYNCVTCGGSCYTYQKYYGRTKPAFKKPEIVKAEVEELSGIIDAPIFVVGDLTMAGSKYASDLLKALGGLGLENEIFFEVYRPVNREIIRFMRRVSDKVYLQISPESPYEDVRSAFGRNYDNSTLEKMISSALDVGLERLDLYFMTGLPKQTYRKAVGVAKYYKHLQEKFECGSKIDVFTAPLAPFVDPGSRVFDYPGKYGYKILWRSLEEYQKAVEQPYWGLMLNYETEWMNRLLLVRASINASLELAKAKYKYHVIGKAQLEALNERLKFDLMISDRAFKGEIRGIEEGKKYMFKEYEATEDLYPSRSLVECLKVPIHLKIALQLMLWYSKLTS